LTRFDWDGVNLADCISNRWKARAPGAVYADDDDYVRADFKKESGIDPKTLLEPVRGQRLAPVSRLPAGLASKTCKRHWLDEIEKRGRRSRISIRPDAYRRPVPSRAFAMLWRRRCAEPADDSSEEEHAIGGRSGTLWSLVPNGISKLASNTGATPTVRSGG